MSKASAPCSSCPAPDVTVEKPKAAKNKIVFELDDELSTKSDSIIKIKKIKQLLNKDLKLFTIVGHVQNFTKLSTNVDHSHHKFNFIIQDKKTNKVLNRTEIDTLLDVNTKQGNGLVTLSVSPVDASKNTKCCKNAFSTQCVPCGINPGTPLAASVSGTSVTLLGGADPPINA